MKSKYRINRKRKREYASTLSKVGRVCAYNNLFVIFVFDYFVPLILSTIYAVDSRPTFCRILCITEYVC